MYYVLSGILVGGNRYDPQPEPIDLPAHCVEHLMKVGAIESARVRDLKLAKERELADIEAKHRKAMDEAIAKEAADVAAQAELEAEETRAKLAAEAVNNAAIAAEKVAKKSRR